MPSGGHTPPPGPLVCLTVGRAWPGLALLLIGMCPEAATGQSPPSCPREIRVSRAQAASSAKGRILFQDLRFK